MTDTKTKRTYPSAFYAAAGVGDLVYTQLRKLPAVAEKLQAKATEQGPQWQKAALGKAAELTAKVDAAKVRDSIVAGTSVVAQNATKFYEDLVQRGEKAFQESSTEAPKTAAPKAEAPKAETPKAETAEPAAAKADAPEAPKAATKRAPRAAK